MDLYATIPAADAVSFCHFRHPATDELLYETIEGEKTAVGLYLYGRDSKQFAEEHQAMNNEALARRKTAKLTDEQVTARACRLLAACVHESVGVSWKGSPVTADNAAEFFVAAPPYREQVDTFISDRANFMPSA